MHATDHDPTKRIADELAASTLSTYARVLLSAAEAARNHMNALTLARRLATDPAAVDALTRQIIDVAAEESRLRLWAATTPGDAVR